MTLTAIPEPAGVVLMCVGLVALVTDGFLQVVIEGWRRHYNEVRPHTSLDWMTPVEYRQRHQRSEEPLAITPELSS